MSEHEQDDPDSTRPATFKEYRPALVTDTGTHPVVVIKPEPQSRFILGLLLDITIVIGIFTLIALDKLTASEGLPWVALLAGVKAKQVFGRTGGSGPGAALTILGITKGIS